jgi:hypothetical protein
VNAGAVVLDASSRLYPVSGPQHKFSNSCVFFAYRKIMDRFGIRNPRLRSSAKGARP